MRGSGSMRHAAATDVCATARNLEHGDRRFGKVGKIAGAGERILAACHRGKRSVANVSDFLLDQALFERGPYAAGPFDLLKLAPRRVAELPA